MQKIRFLNRIGALILTSSKDMVFLEIQKCKYRRIRSSLVLSGYSDRVKIQTKMGCLSYWLIPP